MAKSRIERFEFKLEATAKVKIDPSWELADQPTYTQIDRSKVEKRLIKEFKAALKNLDDTSVISHDGLTVTAISVTP